MNKIKQLFRHRYIIYINALASRHTYFAALNWVGIPLIALYFAGMLVGPPIYHCWAWGKIVDTWAHWQSFSAGMLAFTASIVIFNISKHNAEEQRARDFMAARSLLPRALTELKGYCDDTMNFYGASWYLATKKDWHLETTENGGPKYSMPISQLPENYRGIFKECISVIDPKGGEKLSKRLYRILWELENSHDWMNSLYDRINNRLPFPRGYNGETDIELTFDGLYRIVRIRVWINKTFKFARNLGEFDSSPNDWSDFKKVLEAHGFDYDGIYIHKFPGLEEHFKKRIEKDAKAGE